MIEAPMPNSPERVLIETQNLAGESHAQSHEQQENADDPGKFAGNLYAPKRKDLHHVNENDGNHEIRSPPMQRADVPTDRVG